MVTTSREEASQLTADSAAGVSFALSADDHLALRRVRVARIRDGRWRIVSELLPAAR